MKKVISSILLSMFVLVACNTNKNEQAQSDTTNKEKVSPIVLTKADFLTKVWNYEKDSTEFKFLGEKPCLIDFYADWCGPCKQMAPYIEEVAQEYGGQIDVYKVDVDKDAELVALFGIQSIPTLVFVTKDNKLEIDKNVPSKEELKKKIETILLGKK